MAPKLSLINIYISSFNDVKPFHNTPERLTILEIRGSRVDDVAND